MQGYFKKVSKAKKLVRISLALAICLVFIFSFKSSANDLPVDPTRYQTASTFPKCQGNVCIEKPNDIAISSDGSFIYVVDTSSSEKPGTFLKIIPISIDGQIGEFKSIELSSKIPSLNLATLVLSKNNNKAIVFKDTSQDSEPPILLVDIKNIDSISSQLADIDNKKLISKNVDFDLLGKRITVQALGGSYTQTAIPIQVPFFIDPDGKEAIVGVITPVSSELLTIDTESDKVVNEFVLPDTIQSFHVSPTLKHVIVTYSDFLAQSVSLYDIIKNEQTQLNISSSIVTSVDDFSTNVDFDSLGKRAVISSLGGSHVLHLVDVDNKKLISKVLDKSEGPTIGTISPDGKTCILIGTIFDTFTGFKVYKVNVGSDGKVSVLNSSLFSDESIALDVKVTLDQSKVLILLLKDNKKQFLVLDMKDLSTIKTLALSQDTTHSNLHISPNGLYALTNNINEETISIVKNLDLGPILHNIIPNVASLDGGSPFTINGFVNPLGTFLEDAKVCFRNNNFCATNVLVSNDGKKIIGLTPKFPSSGLEDVIITTTQINGKEKTSKYEGIFQFGTGPFTLADTFPPEITILAPKDLATLNKKRILIFGKVDGTGGAVKTVTVNGKKALLSPGGAFLKNTVNFVSDIQAEGDGPLEITISATDEANNEAIKVVKVNIDTQDPAFSASVETLEPNNFKVSGTASGTGSNISSIIVNSKSIEFTPGENTSFTQTTNTLPIVIVVTDAGGNKKQLIIGDPSTEDNNPPVISVTSPFNGDVFKENPQINVTFSVSDDTLVKEVLLNGSSVTSTGLNQFSQTINLNPGQNQISISVSDTSGNTSKTDIIVTFVPKEILETGVKPEEVPPEDELQDKEIITLPEEVENLSDAIIDEFSQLTTEEGKIIKLSDTVSVEISNPPPIPEGAQANIKIPEVEGLEPSEIEGQPLEVPKGFSFATTIIFEEEPSPTPAPEEEPSPTPAPEEEQDTQNPAVLVDSSGRTFVVGFAFRKEEDTSISGESGLITTFTVPSDATEGDARISILSGNESIATIPLVVAPENEVKVENKIIGKPQIKEPLTAVINKNTNKLKLKIKGKNFIGRVAIIDGKLERLTAKAQFFTNVTFVPNEGIKVKRFKLFKNKIILNAEITSNIKPGIKLFNVVTPKGADIGAIVIPDPVSAGSLETTSNPEGLILE